MRHVGRRFYASVITAPSSKYPLRKQLVWAQCQEYIQRPTLLLVQLDNMNAPTKLAFKTRLSALKLSLVSPKAHILRKALRHSKWSHLEAAVIGSTAILIGRSEPHELAAALKFLGTQQQRATLLGGKIGELAFSVEGVKDIVYNVPPLQELRAQLVGLLETPALSLINGINRAPVALADALDQHVNLSTPNVLKEK